MRGGVGSDGSNTEEPILAKEHGSGLGSAYCHAGPPQGEEVNMECNWGELSQGALMRVKEHQS